MKRFCSEFVFKRNSFSKNEFLRKKEITKFMCEFSKQVDDISKNYRNEAAHTNSTSSVERAKVCVDWIIKVKQLLYKFVEKIDRDRLDEL